MPFQLVTFVVVGYLLGTIPTGLLVARWRGVDIRAVGSGNIGATNVLRSVGPLAALVVAVVDPLKGMLAVALPSLLGVEPWTVVATAFATVLGNTFNPFLRFRGGKGVATALGAFLVIDAGVALLATVMFAIVLWASRYVSLASIVAVCSAPLLLLARGAAPFPTMLLAFALASLIVWRHADNVERLRYGNERRIGEGGPPPAMRPVTTYVEADPDPTPRDGPPPAPPR